MKQNRGSIVSAVILILAGGLFLAIELVPGLKAFAYGPNTWPFLIIGWGAILLLTGLIAWVPGLLIPGCIVTGIGGMLYYQNLTGNWESWAYAWALIPVFVGIGLVLFGLLSRHPGAAWGGMWTGVSGLILFGVFGWAFGKLPGGEKLWPAGLILFGLLLAFSSLIPRRPKSSG